jgi:nitrite reductase (NADH) small subunit
MCVPNESMGAEEFARVATVGDIPVGGARIVEVGGRELAIFNVQGTFYAIHNVCPHQGGPLGEGMLKGFVVRCPWHDQAFDVRTGLAVDGGGLCVGSYEVKVQGNEVLIGPRRRFRFP